MKFITIVVCIIFLFSCDGGLEPTKYKDNAILDVSLNFVDSNSNWPSKDSLYAIRVAAFKKMPDSSIINDIISGNAYFDFNSLPLYIDSSGTRFIIKDAPVNLVYIAAVQQYDSLLTAQRVIGIYTVSGDKTKPSSITINPGQYYSITINVDFNNVPPMPY
ncbi:MAG TPA: hypothetical protein PLE30_08230 [Candidatus Kapabacteria bacterium]|nr:hypothetical protein [Candidatus Kapabacteria bacterium]